MTNEKITPDDWNHFLDAVDQARRFKQKGADAGKFFLSTEDFEGLAFVDAMLGRLRKMNELPNIPIMFFGADGSTHRQGPDDVLYIPATRIQKLITECEEDAANARYNNDRVYAEYVEGFQRQLEALIAEADMMTALKDRGC